MGCSKGFEFKNRSIFYKIGFYGIRIIAYSLIVGLASPFLVLASIIMLFEAIVIGKCTKSSIVLNIGRSKKNKEESNNEVDEETSVVDTEKLKVYGKEDE